MADFYLLEIANWNEGTADLTLEQEGAYLRVINAIRLADQPITFNKFALCGMWRCNERKAKRLLDELIQAGKLRIEGGKIINDKAVEAASDLSRLRADRQSAGRRGGIESGKSRSKPLKSNEQAQASASTIEEDIREENIIAAATSAGASNPDPVDDPTDRERVLSAMGVGPDGVVGPSRFVGGQGDVAEMRRWLALPGMTVDLACARIREIVARRGSAPSSFSYFTEAMQELSAQISAPPLTPSARPQRNPMQPQFPRIRGRLPSEIQQ